MRLLRRSYRFVLCAAIITASVSLSAENEKEPPLRLTLPPVFYAVPGHEMNVYYDNIVCTETPEKYKYKFKCNIGTHEERRWTLTPKATNTGDFKIAVTVSDEKGKIVDKGNTLLRVVPADAGAGKEIRILIIGDSLTAGGAYAMEVGKLLSEPGKILPEYYLIH